MAKKRTSTDTAKGKLAMKERFLDVIKWGLILVMGGVVFYMVCPKYELKIQGAVLYRVNKVVGQLEFWDLKDKTWKIPADFKGYPEK